MKDPQPPLFDLPQSESTDSYPLVVEEDNPNAVRYEYPDTYVEQRNLIRRREMAREVLKPRRSAAYEEIGGRLPEKEEKLDPLYEVLKDTDKNDIDIIEAFEHFNIQKLLEPGRFEHMTKEDKEKLILHFKPYIDRLESMSHTLQTEGMYLHGGFNKYGFEDDDDARRYGEKLGRFLEACATYPAFGQILDAAVRSYPTEHRAYNLRRGHPAESFYVVYDTKSDKLRTHYDQQKAA